MKENESSSPNSVNSLQGIIDQKKKAMEEALLEAETHARTRHDRLISALIDLRQSLREVEKVDMGKRFYLSLLLDDWEGWPRMILKLIDSKNPEKEYPNFIVTSHDRQESATLEIKYADCSEPETLSLNDIRKVTKISGIVKKCLRQHLDMIGDLAIEIEQNEGSKRFSDYQEEDKKETQSASNSEVPEVTKKNENDEQLDISLDI